MEAMSSHVESKAEYRSMSSAETALSSLLRALPIKHGRHRLLDRIKPALWPHTTAQVKMPYQGRELLMDADDLVGWHFLILGSFDPEVSEVLCAVGADSARQVIWDIGANKGACAYAMSTALPRCQVVLIEPQATLTEMLEHNMRVLAPGRFELHAVGVGVQEETLELAIPDDNKGRASLVHDFGVDHGRRVMVQIRTAQQIAGASAFGWPTLVKIDVEGFEPQVFESLAPALAARACEAIVFENHPDQMEAFGRIHAAVQCHGYQVFAIRKTPFATKLRACDAIVAAATDYVVLRDDLIERAGVRRLMA